MESQEKKSKKVYLPLFAVILLVVGFAVYYYVEYSKYITTDDAKVDSDNVAVSSKVLGRIAKLYVDEQDSVKVGQLIAELDSTDMVSQKLQAEALVVQAEANQTQSSAKLRYDEENIKVQEVNLSRAKEDYDRAKEQIAGDVITKEQFDHTKKTYESAKAVLEAAKKQLDVSRAQVLSSVASIKNAQAQVGVFSSQLKNMKLYAPMTGEVAKRWLLAGDVVQPGQSIFTVTNTKKLWVVIYIEETKLAEIYVGMPAIYTIDAFDGVKFKGKVYAIGANTASLFSLIPANNASGNFTKVTQRVAVKISIDETSNGTPLSGYKILSGMSAVVKLIKK